MKCLILQISQEKIVVTVGGSYVMNYPMMFGVMIKRSKDVSA